MNYQTINYAFLSGALQSEMTDLAYDTKFLQMKDAMERRDYLNAIIAKAHAQAAEFEKKMASA